MECEGLYIDPATVESNILIFDLKNRDAADAVEELEQAGVRMVPFGPQTLRATFHFEIGDEELEEVKEEVKKLFA